MFDVFGCPRNNYTEDGTLNSATRGSVSKQAWKPCDSFLISCTLHKDTLPSQSIFILQTPHLRRGQHQTAEMTGCARASGRSSPRTPRTPMVLPPGGRLGATRPQQKNSIRGILGYLNGSRFGGRRTIETPEHGGMAANPPFGIAVGSARRSSV